MTGLLGLFLILTWLQQPAARALAWWGSAYMVAAAAMAVWASPAPFVELPRDLSAALIFVACGLLWNGVRLFHGRAVAWGGIAAGAIVWLVLCQFPALQQGTIAHAALGVLIVAVYTALIVTEFWRERRATRYSRSGTVMMTCLHAVVLLVPLTVRVLLPDLFFSNWLALVALETIVYAVGIAFIMLLIVKDHDVNVQRTVANTDHLTGLLNRRAFMERSLALCAQQGARGLPVTLLMFDLDHFKSINDRFGHATGDDVLRLFAQVVRTGTRASDISGRLGGEEFAAILPGSLAVVAQVAERIRAGFEAVGVTVGPHAIGATLSIGAATSYAPVTSIDGLMARADAALYQAKHGGRNRMHAADDEPGSEPARQADAQRRAQAAAAREKSQRQKPPLHLAPQ
ncbi:MAG: GGDEF domain-containing protein [Pseudolabrys sp.]|nr:GGDEF domain-containing protein [Pseudolabrys sp.]